MKKFIFITAALFITACAPTTQFPNADKESAAREADIQREIALNESHKYFMRLQDVAAPLFMANAEICPKDKVKPFYGFHVASLDEYQDEYKDAVYEVHSLQYQPSVFHVSPNTPSYNKFQKGDVITKINDQKIDSGKKGVTKILDYLYDEKRLGEKTNFVIEREDKPYQMMIEPKAACGGRAILSDEVFINAMADGTNIIFTKPMMDITKTDDELALVIGHEIAHNSRNHVEAGQGNVLVGMVLGAAVSVATGVNVMGVGGDLGAMAFSQDFESEADYVGLYHVARAGYAIENAPYIWRRMAAVNPAAIDMVGQSHPSNARRFVALEAAVKEIKQKQAAGQPLMPEEQKIEDTKKEIGQYN